ncbi:unnamed protein product [Symbiodinium sp. KB8]|nr:unnamed protein product [Symbiodinium sp. KB8]
MAHVAVSTPCIWEQHGLPDTMESGIAWDALEFPEGPRTRALSMKEPRLLQKDFYGFSMELLLTFFRLIDFFVCGSGLRRAFPASGSFLAFHASLRLLNLSMQRISNGLTV